LQTAHHDAGRALAFGPLQLGLDGPHHLDELVLADRDEWLFGRDRLDAVLLTLRTQLDLLAARLLLHTLEETFDDAELDIAFEQREPNIAQRFIDDIVGELGNTGKPLARGTESLGEGL
jgi:hypothetical protein